MNATSLFIGACMALVGLLMTFFAKRLEKMFYLHGSIMSNEQGFKVVGILLAFMGFILFLYSL
jgi:hypothetical protein